MTQKGLIHCKIKQQTDTKQNNSSKNKHLQFCNNRSGEVNSITPLRGWRSV